FNLGTAYLTRRPVPDLDEAERCYMRSLDMHGEEAFHGRAQCLAQMGTVAHERFKAAQAAKKPAHELLDRLNTALRFCCKALEFLPPNAVDNLASTHNQIGNIYGDAGDLVHALPHYQCAIHYKEKQGDIFGAGQTRHNVAVNLAQAGRFHDARLYA